MTSRSLLALDRLELALRHAVGADDERAALDLVGQVGGADAAVGQVGLDAGVVHQLAEGGDLLALGCRVLGLVDRQPHAIAEAGALGDADVGSGCRGHRPHSRSIRGLTRVCAPGPSGCRAVSGYITNDIGGERLGSLSRETHRSDAAPAAGAPAISRMIRSVPSASASRSSRPSGSMRQRERLADADPDASWRAASAIGPERCDACPRSRPAGAARPIAWPGRRLRACRPSGDRHASACPRRRCRSGDRPASASSEKRWAARSPSPRRTK